MAVPQNVKRPAEVRVGSFDFKNFPEIVAGETLSVAQALVISPTGTLTAGAVSISGTQVQAVLSGGTDGTVYTLTSTVTTNLNHTLVCVGTLAVNAS